MFILQNTEVPVLEESQLRMSMIEIVAEVSKFDLLLDLRETDEGLVGRLEYNTDLFDDSTIERLLMYYETLLEDVMANPWENVDNLRLAKEDESQRLLSALLSNKWAM
jgi:non-ribosomal peptide synthetase component F